MSNANAATEHQCAAQKSAQARPQYSMNVLVITYKAKLTGCNNSDNVLFIANEPILYCDAQGLQLSDVMPSQKHQRLLLLSAHDQSLNFHIWKIPPTCEE